MELSDVWNDVDYIRNEDEEIIAVRVPIDKWRFLLDRVQAMEDKQAARQRLAKLRGKPSSSTSDDA